MNSQTEITGFEITAVGPINTNMPAYTGPAYDSPEAAAQRAADALEDAARLNARIVEMAAAGYALDASGRFRRVA